MEFPLPFLHATATVIFREFFIKLHGFIADVRSSAVFVCNKKPFLFSFITTAQRGNIILFMKQNLTRYSTIGVLPVPPTERFPIQINRKIKSCGTKYLLIKKPVTHMDDSTIDQRKRNKIFIFWLITKLASD